LFRLISPIERADEASAVQLELRPLHPMLVTRRERRIDLPPTLHERKRVPYFLPTPLENHRSCRKSDMLFAPLERYVYGPKAAQLAQRSNLALSAGDITALVSAARRNGK
jgi:hypothetical protein